MEQCFGTKKSKCVEFNWATVTYIQACVAAGPRTRLNHLYSPSANQCTTARSNILQSRKDTCERLGQADFLPVSYEPHDWPNSYVCVTVGRSDMSKFTEGGRQGSCTVKKEQVEL